MSARRVTGIEYDAIRILMILQIWWLGVRLYRDPAVAFRATVKMVRRFSELNGRNKLVRAYKLNGTYAWDMFNPAWPSQGFNRFFTTHLREVVPAQGNSQSLCRRIFFSRIPTPKMHFETQPERWSDIPADYTW